MISIPSGFVLRDGEAALGWPPTLGEGLQFTVPDGRQARLIQLSQYETYGGMLAGLPHNIERDVANAVRAAQQWDSGKHPKPYIVPGEIRHGLKKSPAHANLDPEKESRPWYCLAPVVCVGVFEAGAQAGRSLDCESVLAIWWQDAFGAVDPGVAEKLKNLPWSEFATELGF